MRMAASFDKCPGCKINIPTADVEDYVQERRCPFDKGAEICPFMKETEDVDAVIQQMNRVVVTGALVLKY
jgi:hypothetical protein